MHERPGYGKEFEQLQMANAIFAAAHELLQSLPDTLSVTYRQAQTDPMLPPVARRTAFRSIEALAHTFGSGAGAIAANKSYTKTLNVYDQEQGRQLTYGVTHTESEKGASAHQFTLYINEGDTYRILGVYANGAGRVSTRDSIEFVPTDFEMRAYQIVDDTLVGHLGPLLHGEIMPGKTLDEELILIRLSLLGNSEVDADEFIKKLREHFDRRAATAQFKQALDSSMSQEQMQRLLDYLCGDPVRLTVFDEHEDEI